VCVVKNFLVTAIKSLRVFPKDEILHFSSIHTPRLEISPSTSNSRSTADFLRRKQIVSNGLASGIEPRAPRIFSAYLPARLCTARRFGPSDWAHGKSVSRPRAGAIRADNQRMAQNKIGSAFKRELDEVAGDFGRLGLGVGRRTLMQGDQ
jgi:hypothetical protein